MKIETKYDVGDEVWFMDNNNIVLSKINKPCILQMNINDFNWELEFETNCGFLVAAFLPKSCVESKLFLTKEELIASLQK